MSDKDGEFFDLESFARRADFPAKAFTYQLYFNLVRPNSHKQNLSPWQIIEQLQPRWPLQLAFLPPLFLDYLGYDLPRLPCGPIRDARRQRKKLKRRPLRAAFRSFLLSSGLG